MKRKDVENVSLKTKSNKELPHNNKNKIFILVAIGILLIILSALGILFIPKYLSTKALALFVAEYRRDAEIENQKETNCSFQEERDAATIASEGSFANVILKQIQLYNRESECFIKQYANEYIWDENKIIKLERIDLTKTKYENDGKAILDSIKLQKDFADVLRLYSIDYYANQINYLYCKKNAAANQLSSDESYFLKNFSEDTLAKAIEECNTTQVNEQKALDERFSTFKEDSEAYEKAINTSRELTKKLNEILNN